MFTSWVLQTLASSGVAILAFLAIRSTKLGERLLDHHLSRRITELKHAHDEQIEQLRSELAHLQDRGRRANEREFDAVSRIWKAFVDAFLKTNQAVISYISFPDLDKLQTDELTSFLEASELSPPQRQQVLGATEKVRTYGNIMQLRHINTAGAAIFDARLLLRTNGIFISKEQMDSLKNGLQMLAEAQVERFVEFQNRHSLGGKAASRLLKEGDNIFDELQTVVRKTLRGT